MSRQTKQAQQAMAVAQDRRPPSQPSAGGGGTMAPMTKMLPNSSLVGGRNQSMLQQPNGASGPMGDTD